MTMVLVILLMCYTASKSGQISGESYLLADKTNRVSPVLLVNGTPASQLSTLNCMKSPSPTPASPEILKKVSRFLSHTHIHLHTIIQLMLHHIWLDLRFLLDHFLCLIIGLLFILDHLLPFQHLVTHSLCVLRRRTRRAPNVQPNSTHSLRGEIAMGYLAMS